MVARATAAALAASLAFARPAEVRPAASEPAWAPPAGHGAPGPAGGRAVAPAAASVAAAVRSATAAGPARFLVRLNPPPQPFAAAPIPRDRRARIAATQRLLEAGAARAAGLDTELERLARSGAVSSAERFPAFGVIAVTGDRTAVDALARAPGVAAIQADRSHRIDGTVSHRWPAGQADVGPRPGGWNLDAVAAPRAWRALGATGGGATVGVIDTGADWRHPALSPSYRGRPGGHHHHWIDLASPRGASEPVDLNGHGTHVTGLIAGRFADEAYGVAPGARWIAAQAFDADGDSSDTVLLRAAQWMLAPTRLDGTSPRPDLAPDIVNGSWGLDNSADPLFDAVVEAWRAAGILAVFAAGNADIGTVWDAVLAPGGHPLALAVGAVDARGMLWWRSRRGPGFHAGVKPDLVAPGVDVVSTWPGGGSASFDGTSMAAPHVAGAAAVLRGLDPSLTPDDLAGFLRAGARDAGPPGPDLDSGWGTLDVFAAAVLALDAGRVAGRVVDARGRSLSGAAVRAEGARAATAPWSAVTDDDGRFDVALPSGTWQLAAAAFGHAVQARRVDVRRGETLAVDFVLSAAPAAVVHGTIGSAAGGIPEHARVDVAGIAGGAAEADAAGRYSLALPAGTHALRFSADAHQAISRTLVAVPGGSAGLDVVLPVAPRILFVDADAWDEERIGPYIRRALDDGGYPHAAWTVDRLAAAPTAADLAAFDVVVWSHGYNSPGRLDLLRGDSAVTDALATFVTQGGRLLLTGQDVGAFDAATPRRTGLAPAFYRRILGAALVRDVAGSELRALGVGPLEGLSLGLAWPGGAEKGRRGVLPDAVLPAPEAEPGTVQPILMFPDGQIAGLATADANGRRIYLAFGPESAGGRVALARMFDRLIGWLEPPSVSLVAPASVGPGDAFRLELTARAGRSAAAVTGGILPPPGIVLEPDGDWAPGSGGALSWSGPLAAGEVRRWSIAARLDGHRRGATRLPITATLEANAYRATATAVVQPRAPALAASRLALAPARRPIGGPVSVTLRLDNVGPVAADGASAWLALPDGLTPISNTLAASGGDVWWDGDALRRAGWSGGLRPGMPVTVTLAGRIADRRGVTHVVTATLRDGIDQVITRTGAILVGGPDLGATHFADPPAIASAGVPLSATLRLINVGPVEARATASIPLPDGITVDAGGGASTAADAFVWTGTVEPGATRDVTVRLWVAGDAAPGPRVLTATIADGWSPPHSVTAVPWTVEVRRAVLDGSRIVLWPATPRSGGVLSATLLVGNHGNAAADVELVDSLSPALTPLVDAVRASGGTVEVQPGTVRWRVQVPPISGTEYRPRLGGPAASPVPGHPLPPVDPATGTRGPVELGLAFPFYRQVYTQAWVTDGLVSFVAVDPSGPDLPPVPSIAARLRPGDSPPPRSPAPTIRRDGDRTVFMWPDAAGNPNASTTLELRPEGRVAFGYGPEADLAGTLVGLRAPDGHMLEVPDHVTLAGYTTELDPPGAWAWLNIPARVGHTLDANRAVGHVVRLLTGDTARSFGASTIANRLVLDAGIARTPSHATAGSTVRYTVSLRALGVVDARDAEVEVDVPDGAAFEPSPPGSDWNVDAVSRSARWRGGVPIGMPRLISWSLRLRPDLPVGARIVTHAAVRTRSGSVPPVDLWNVARLEATDLSSSTIRAIPVVARTGAVVTFELRAVNSGRRAADVEVVDALPDGLTFVDGSAESSSGPAPQWDPASRSLRWEGPLAAGGASVVRFEARFSGRERVVNAMRVADAEGTAFAAWAEVVAERARTYLPLVENGD